MLKMEPRHYQMVLDILKQYPQYQFYAFGSRVVGTPRQFSDFDICSMTPIARSVISEIKEKFSLSNLPYSVDIIDWSRCSAEFQALIKDDLVKIG